MAEHPILGEQRYGEWAPPTDVWSPWVKPSLFAQMTQIHSGTSQGEWERIDTFWARGMSSQTALIVDLPGLESLHAGFALAQEGYRPVPLYNTSHGDPRPVLDVKPLLDGLSAPLPDAVKSVIGRNAPPAFLIDSRRFRQTKTPDPGTFDNRWVVFPQDFPSANFLRARGITRAILIQADEPQPQDDLTHVLLRWQEHGMQILLKLRGTGTPQEIRIQRPSRFRALRARTMVMMGLHRNSAGGFGAVIPLVTSGGGYS